MLGAAWQAGLVPLSAEAIARAIELNGAGVEGNHAAFAIGRWAVAMPARRRRPPRPAPAPPADDLDTIVDRRAAHLAAYQGRRLARRYRDRVAAAAAVDPAFAKAMAKGYHKLLAYKDEYEVARLHAETTRAAVDAGFTDVRAMRFHLAPPFLGGHDAGGRPKKRSFGPWMLGAFGVLRRFRFLRGTPLRSLRLHRRAPRRATADRGVRGRHGARCRPGSRRRRRGSPPSSRRCRSRSAASARSRPPPSRPPPPAAPRSSPPSTPAGKGRSMPRSSARRRRRRRPPRRLRHRRSRRAPDRGRRRPLQQRPGRGALRRPHRPADRARRRASRGRRRTLHRALEPLQGRARLAVAARRPELRPAVAGDHRQLHRGRALRLGDRADRHPLGRSARLSRAGARAGVPAGARVGAPAGAPAGAGAVRDRAIRCRTIPTSSSPCADRPVAHRRPRPPSEPVRAGQAACARPTDDDRGRGRSPRAARAAPRARRAGRRSPPPRSSVRRAPPLSCR